MTSIWSRSVDDALGDEQEEDERVVDSKLLILLDDINFRFKLYSFSVLSFEVVVLVMSLFLEISLLFLCCRLLRQKREIKTSHD